jgi:hypothetical protein
MTSAEDVFQNCSLSVDVLNKYHGQAKRSILQLAGGTFYRCDTELRPGLSLWNGLSNGPRSWDGEVAQLAPGLTEDTEVIRRVLLMFSRSVDS